MPVLGVVLSSSVQVYESSFFGLGLVASPSVSAQLPLQADMTLPQACNIPDQIARHVLYCTRVLELPTCYQPGAVLHPRARTTHVLPACATPQQLGFHKIGHYKRHLMSLSRRATHKHTRKGSDAQDTERECNKNMNIFRKGASRAEEFGL
eukprot:1156201-Pelagomonas_calceolata.AAC.4